MAGPAPNFGTPAPDSDEGGQPEVTFELDFEAPASPAPGEPVATPSDSVPAAAGVPPGSPSAAAPPVGAVPPAVQEAIDRAAAAERRSNELVNALQPYLGLMQQQFQGQQGPKHKSIEELQHDPNLTPTEIVQFVNHQVQQQLAQYGSQIAYESRRASSEQYARGAFSPQNVGQGFDYDAMRARWLEPHFRTNPQLEQAINLIIPDNPATAQYLAAFVQEMHAAAGGDVVKMVNNVRRAMASTVAGAQDLSRKIDQAARQGAHRVFAGSQGGPGQPTKKVSNVWELSEREFDDLDRQNTRGLF